MRLIALALIAVTTLGAQELSRVSPPRIRFKVEPKYSKEASAARLVGTVLLSVMVGTDGMARDFKVLRSVGLGLDENAIAAVAAWVFEPGTKDGEPVDVKAQIEVNFRLRLDSKGSQWHLERVDFHLPDGASRPVVEKVAAPLIEDDSASPNVRLTFDIDEQGVPVNIPIETASNEGFSREVAAALGKWRFKPAFKDGTPISVSCTVDFVRGN